jgi:aryl-alcohol dehydrogenase-like predicted oxidoreductase
MKYADPKYPEYRSKVIIVLKGGSTDVANEMTAGLDRNREMIKQATELIGKRPEVYSLARLPPDLSFEETFQNMKTLLDEGLFGAYGASEMKRASLERAQKVSTLLYHITAVKAHLITAAIMSDLLFLSLMLDRLLFNLMLTYRSSQSLTSRLKSPYGPTNLKSKKSSLGPRRTRSLS